MKDLIKIQIKYLLLITMLIETNDCNVYCCIKKYPLALSTT